MLSSGAGYAQGAPGSPSWPLPSQLVCTENLTALQPLELGCHPGCHLVTITSVLLPESCCCVQLGLVSRSLGRAWSDEHTVLRAGCSQHCKVSTWSATPGSRGGRGSQGDRGQRARVRGLSALWRLPDPIPKQMCLPPVTCPFPVPRGPSWRDVSPFLPDASATADIPQRRWKGAGAPRLLSSLHLCAWGFRGARSSLEFRAPCLSRHRPTKACTGGCGAREQWHSAFVVDGWGAVAASCLCPTTFSVMSVFLLRRGEAERALASPRRALRPPVV